MEHHFNVQVAQQYGVEEAIIIHNLFHWISKNAANDENMFDGLYWTYNSIKAYSLLFPYLSETKVKRVFKNLEEKGIIVKGNFSDDKWLRTNWYSFPLDTLYYLNSVGYSVHWVKTNQCIGSKCTNGDGQNDQMITNNKPNSNKEIEDNSSIEKNWRNDYSIYCDLIEKAVGILLVNEEYQKQQEEVYINIDYKRTIIATGNYWKDEEQWKSYKLKKIKNPNFISTIKRSFQLNKVYKPRFQQQEEIKPELTLREKCDRFLAWLCKRRGEKAMMAYKISINDFSEMYRHYNDSAKLCEAVMELTKQPIMPNEKLIDLFRRQQKGE